MSGAPLRRFLFLAAPSSGARGVRCSDVECTEKIELTLLEYEDVRARPTMFFIVPGHERLEVERVIDQNARFATVEKLVRSKTSRPRNPSPLRVRIGPRMTSREERLSLNQATFRSANEGMVEVVNVDGARRIPFLCECADLDCLGRLEATVAEFEEAHDGEDRYFILPGHLRIESEEILSENGRYEIVSKA